MTTEPKKPANNQGKTEVALPSVDQAVKDSLKDVLNPAQQRKVLERLIPKLELIAISTTQKYHSGPLPSADTVAAYEQHSPGSFNRIIAMAEKDQQAVINSADFAAKSDSKFRIICMGAGLAALLCILGTIIYLAATGHDNAAIAVAGLGAAGIVSAFVNARWKSKE
jgi:uncharacterized membrane protein